VDFSASGRAQFLEQLLVAMEELAVQAETGEEETETHAGSQEEAADLIGEENIADAGGETAEATARHGSAPQSEMMEQVLNHGMEFLSGLLKMTTGKDTGLENKRVEIDRETGEVVMRFRLPGL
jgi:hypothetical protein